MQLSDTIRKYRKVLFTILISFFIIDSIMFIHSLNNGTAGFFSFETTSLVSVALCLVGLKISLSLIDKDK